MGNTQLIGFVSLCAVSTVACGGYDGTSPEYDAPQIVERMQAAYQAAETYQHVESEVVTFTYQDPSRDSRYVDTTSLAFARPDWLVEETLPGWPMTVEQEVSNADEVWRNGELRPDADMYPSAFDALLRGARSGQDNDTFRAFASADVVGNADVDGTPCFELALAGDGDTYERLWVGAEDFLVRRYARQRLVDVAERLREALWDFQMMPTESAMRRLVEARDPANDYTLDRISTYRPILNQPLPELAFLPKPERTSYVGVGVNLDVEDQVEARIAKVHEGTPAERQGLRAGDIVLAVDGAPVHGPREMQHAVLGRDPGDSVRLTVDRNGERWSVAVNVDHVVRLADGD